MEVTNTKLTVTTIFPNLAAARAFMTALLASIQTPTA
jgi:hypothetical protein